MYRSSHFLTVVINKVGPSCTFNIGEHSRSRIFQLDHNHWLQISELVIIGKKVAGKSSPWRVGDRPNVLFIRVHFPIAVEPDHVELWATVHFVWKVFAVFLPCFSDVSFEIFWHVGVVVHLCYVIVRFRLPTINAIEL